MSSATSGLVSGTDLELLQAWRDGVRAAGEVLFERYYDAVDRFFANKIGTAVDADDLVQQTFVACVEGRERIGSGSFRAYLFGAAHNLLRAYYRRQRRDAGRFDPEVVSAMDLSPGPGTFVAHRAGQRTLLEALRRIPVRYQVILELRLWEEMSTAEIAEVLDIPHGTTRSRLRRGRALLLEAVAELRGGARDSDVVDVDTWSASLAAALRSRSRRGELIKAGPG